MAERVRLMLSVAGMITFVPTICICITNCVLFRRPTLFMDVYLLQMCIVSDVPEISLILMEECASCSM